jgi:hypothetical protein
MWNTALSLNTVSKSQKRSPDEFDPTQYRAYFIDSNIFDSDWPNAPAQALTCPAQTHNFQEPPATEPFFADSPKKRDIQ